MNKDKVEILATTPDYIDAFDRRVGVTVCPHCSTDIEFSQWSRCIIAYSLDSSRFSKTPAYIIEINRCPECDEISWLHCQLSTASRNVSGDAKERLENELERRELAAVREVQNSRCIKCQNIYKISMGYDVTAQRSCRKGFGPVVNECQMYEELE